MNQQEIKDNLYRHYIAEKWLLVHKQSTADQWRFNLFANELNVTNTYVGRKI